MRRGMQKKPEIFFLLFLAFAMGATDAFLRWRKNYQRPPLVMQRYLSLWQPNEFSGEENVTILISQLDFHIPSDRWAAAATLSRTGCQQAVPFLIEAMGDDRGTGRTCVMAQSLGMLSDRRAVPALIKALDHPSNEDLRVCASEALGRIGDIRATEPLIEAFNAERVSFSALKSLGQIGGSQAEGFLNSVAQNAPGSMEAVTARDALEDITIGTKRNDSHYLQTMLSTARGQRRRWIVELLAGNEHMEAVDILAKLLADENEDAEIRGIAAAGLVLRRRGSLDILHQFTVSQSRSTQHLANAAIAQIEIKTQETAKNQKTIKEKDWSIRK
jgi:HEAT repeat protein